MLTLILVCFLLFILVRSIYKWKFRSTDAQTKVKQLPGPLAFPFLAHLTLFLNPKQKPYEKLAQLSEKYGPIFGLKIFNKRIIVVSGLNFMKRTFKQWSFADRPDLPTFEALTKNDDFDRFTFMNADRKWKFYRQNCAKALSLFSTSKNCHLQALVEEGCRNLWSNLEQRLGEPIFVKDAIFRCTSGIIGAMNFGMQFNPNDPLLKEIVGFTDRSTKFFTFASILDHLPGSKFFLKHSFSELQSNVAPVDKLIDQYLKNHSFDHIKVTSVSDALSKRSQEVSDEKYQSLQLSKEHLRRQVLDLFVAGFATVTETFLWSLACMARFTQVQEKVQNELDEKLAGRFPTVDDKVGTPFTEATILEVFRYSSLLPFAVPHAIAYDTIFEGYLLPRGAVVLPNLWAHHYDEEVFHDSRSFKPERFLDQNGQVDLDFAQNVVPFGLGKRRCLGENLARQEIYLLFASTMQKFRVSLPADQEDLDFDRDVDESIVRILKPRRFVFQKRL